MFVRHAVRFARTAPVQGARMRFSTSATARYIEEDVTSERLAQLLEASKESGKPVLVDFFADWCQPCKMLSPILHRLVNDPKLVSGREVDLVTVDVDKNMEAAQLFKVRGWTNAGSRHADGTCVQGRQGRHLVCGRAPRAQAQGVHRVALAAAPQHRSGPPHSKISQFPRYRGA